MPRRSALLLALPLFAVVWAPPSAHGQRPSVQSATPADVRLEPGGAGVRVAVSGADLHYFDSASITVNGRSVAGTRATLDTRADSRTRHVDLVAGEGTVAVSGATLSLHSSRLRTSLVVPVRIEVAPSPLPPTAVASAPATVSPGDPVVLDGSQSTDPDGEVVRWAWTLVASSGGSGGDLQMNQPIETDQPTFDLGLTGTTLAPGVHRFHLEVTDDAGLRSQSVQLEVRVLANQAPTAVASAHSAVSPGDPVVLDGSGSSDPDGQIVRWAWTLVASSGGSGGSLQINQPMETDQPTFDLGLTGTTLAPGVHRFQLEVTDDAGLRSQPVQLEVRVLANQAPTAVASAPSAVSPGDPVVLDGSASIDPDGQIVRWTWTLVASSGGSGGSLQINQPMETDQPEFDLGLTGTTLAPGVHRFQLEVTDDAGLRSQPVQLEVRVLADQPPTAVASVPGTVGPRDPVVLDGSRSTDPDGQVVQWTWTLVESSGGSGGSLQINQPIETDQPTFDLGLTGTTLSPGVHRFQLEVTDDSGLRSQPIQFEVRVLGS